VEGVSKNNFVLFLFKRRRRRRRGLF
jgi:hypothetical protein